MCFLHGKRHKKDYTRIILVVIKYNENQCLMYRFESCYKVTKIPETRNGHLCHERYSFVHFRVTGHGNKPLHSIRNGLDMIGKITQTAFGCQYHNH